MATVFALAGTIIGVFIFKALFHFGVLTSSEAVLTGVVVVLCYKSLKQDLMMADMERSRK